MALDFLAGCAGGMAGVIVGYPMDTIKVHLQTQDFRNPKYRGTWNCFTTIVRHESFHALYKGMTSPMAGIAVVNAIAFGVYGNVQRLLSDDKNSMFSVVIAGAASGLAQSIVSCPMELAKTKMQLQQNGLKTVHHANPTSGHSGVLESYHNSSREMKPYKNPVDCLVRIHRQEGFRGVFRGCLITAFRDVPSFGIYFGTYEYFYQSLNRFSFASTSVQQAVSVILAGGLSGTASWIFTYPLDVIKTRLQMDGSAGGPRIYRGIMDCIVTSYKNEGMKAFSRGLNSTVIRAFPTNAATFLVADLVFKVFAPAVRQSNDNKQPLMTIERKETAIDRLFVQDELSYLSSCIEIAIY